MTESTSIPRTDYTRNAVAEVDGVIDSDLVYAMSNLPVVGAAKNESRINQDMARQLAGEAYLGWVCVMLPISKRRKMR